MRATGAVMAGYSFGAMVALRSAMAEPEVCPEKRAFMTVAPGLMYT